jgi:hypothetical protein
MVNGPKIGNWAELSCSTGGGTGGTEDLSYGLETRGSHGAFGDSLGA